MLDLLYILDYPHWSFYCILYSLLHYAIISSSNFNDFSNSVVKTIRTNGVFYGGTASQLYNPSRALQKTITEVNSPSVKYVVWSVGGFLVALMNKQFVPQFFFLFYVLTCQRVQPSPLPIGTSRSTVLFMISFASSLAHGMTLVIYVELHKYCLPQG